MISVFGLFGPGPPPKWNRVAFAGMQLKQLSTLSANSPFFSATPTIQPGYEWVLAQITTPDSETLTPLSDGTASYAGSAARQQWLNAIYNLLLLDWYPTDEAGDYFTIYVNNLAPTQTLLVEAQLAWTNILWDGPILDDYVSDPEGDALTWDTTLGDTLPTGVTIQTVVLNSGEPNERTVQRLRGTPTTGQEGPYDIILRATDVAGDSVTFTAFTLTVGVGVLVPTVDGGGVNYLDALEDFDTAGLGNVDVAPEINGAPVGDVFDQEPTGGTYVIPGTSGILYVSGIAAPDVDDPGTSQTTATNAITAASLTPAVTSAYSSTVPVGEVISQDPAAGTILVPADIVTITVSLGLAGGVILTTFLNDATAVSNASFRGGSAYAQDGTRYIALWPANNAVVYRGPFAHRADGALIIATSGTTAARPQGVAVTSRGEVLAAVDTPVVTHNGWPMLESGYVCMSEVA